MSAPGFSLSAATVECLAMRHNDKGTGVSKADSNDKFLSCVTTAVDRDNQDATDSVMVSVPEMKSLVGARRR
jgi:hypothetical protein